MYLRSYKKKYKGFSGRTFRMRNVDNSGILEEETLHADADSMKKLHEKMQKEHKLIEEN